MMVSHWYMRTGSSRLMNPVGGGYRLPGTQRPYTPYHRANIPIHSRIRIAPRICCQSFIHGDLLRTDQRPSRPSVLPSRTQLTSEVDRTFAPTAQNDNLQIHEEKSKGIYVKNLSDFYVSNAREVYEIMRQGGAARVVSSTSAHKPYPLVSV